MKGFSLIQVLFIEDPAINAKNSFFVDPRMVGILVILGLMFIIICVVLQMFSRYVIHSFPICTMDMVWTLEFFWSVLNGQIPPEISMIFFLLPLPTLQHYLISTNVDLVIPLTSNVFLFQSPVCWEPFHFQHSECKTHEFNFSKRFSKTNLIKISIPFQMVLVRRVQEHHEPPLDNIQGSGQKSLQIWQRS